MAGELNHLHAAVAEQVESAARRPLFRFLESKGFDGDAFPHAGDIAFRMRFRILPFFLAYEDMLGFIHLLQAAGVVGRC